MKKFLSITILAVLGLTMHTTEAKAFGRKRGNSGCNGGAGYAGSGCYGSTGYSSGYGTGCSGGAGYANPVRYGSGYGSPMYYGSTYGAGYGGTYSTPMTYGSTYSTPMYSSAPVSSGYAGSTGCVQTYGTVGTSTSAYTPAMAMPSTGTTGTTGTTTATSDKIATITVMLPSADAQVWIDDTLTTQSGKERSLTTGALAEGKSYDYVVKAKWTDDSGKKVEKSKTVSVKAGQTSTADFR